MDEIGYLLFFTLWPKPLIMLIWVTIEDVAWRQRDVVRELTINPNEHGYNRYLGGPRSFPDKDSLSGFVSTEP